MKTRPIISLLAAVLCASSAVAINQAYNSETDRILTPEEAREIEFVTRDCEYRASKGDPVGLMRLGLVTYTQSPENGVQALDMFRQAARAGDPLAYNMLAQIYSQGELLPKDSVSAVKLYMSDIRNAPEELEPRTRRASVDPVYEMAVATSLLNGVGVEPDEARALQYFELVAATGSADAMMGAAQAARRLGDTGKAVSYYEAAATAGNDEALYLAGMLLSDQSDPESQTKGTDYLQRALDKGIVAAATPLACIKIVNGDKKSMSEAYDLYKLAAEAGDVDAQLFESMCRIKGIGTDIDYYGALAGLGTLPIEGNSRWLPKFVDAITDSADKSAVPFNDYLKGLVYLLDGDYARTLDVAKALEKSGLADAQVLKAAVLADPGYSGYNLDKAYKMLKKAASKSPRASQLVKIVADTGNNGALKGMVYELNDTQIFILKQFRK